MRESEYICRSLCLAQRGREVDTRAGAARVGVVQHHGHRTGWWAGCCDLGVAVAVEQLSDVGGKLGIGAQHWQALDLLQR